MSSGVRFIHKNGKAIPIHSDHGDQQAPGPQHAQAMNPPKNPAPVEGKEHHNHPEARSVASAAVVGAAAGAAGGALSGGPVGAAAGAVGGAAVSAHVQARKNKKNTTGY